MAGKLAMFVHVDGAVYGPDDDVPADVAKKIENPAAWADAPPASEDPAEPAGNGSRAEWAAFAAQNGAPEADTADGGLTRDELRDKYGK